MSRFPISRFTKVPVEKSRKLNPGDKIVLLTFKKDRKVQIQKKDEHIYDVKEDGFETKLFADVEDIKLEKLLKQLQQIEFPRSNMFFLEVVPGE